MKQEHFRLGPTGLWLIFGPVLACMWVAAVNYENNLVYAILYLIAALSFVSIFHTWRNLTSLEIEHIRVHPAFSGRDVRLEIHLRNQARQPVYGIAFAQLEEEGGLRRRVTPLRLSGGPLVVAPGDSLCAEVSFPTVARGMYRFETLLVRTSYPFGLFRASVRVRVAADYFVYPAPHGQSGWPPMQAGGDDGAPSSPQPGDDFAGVRPYVPGESLRQVDWKAFARGRPLSVKQFTGGSGHELWLDAASMTQLPLEARLSQLALWIVNADKEEIPFALKLGRVSLPLGQGETQVRRALEALAVAGMVSA